MRFLITGATSMIGLALGEELLEQGHQLVMVARRMTEDLERFTHSPNTAVVFCDMCDYGKIADLVLGMGHEVKRETIENCRNRIFNVIGQFSISC